MDKTASFYSSPGIAQEINGSLPLKNKTNNVCVKLDYPLPLYTWVSPEVVNDKLLSFAWPSAELFLALTHPDDADFAQMKMQKAFETFKNSSFNFRFIRKDGITRHGYTEWKFEFDANSKPLRLFGILQDITERKEAEEELNKSNERFEMAVSATNDVIWDWNMTTDEFWWNENYYSFFGYDRNTPPDIISWYEGFHPDDKERVLAGIHTSIKNKQNFWTDEYRFLKADGTVAFVLDCGYILYTKKGKPYRMVGAMLDITNRKKTEEDLKKSFDEKQALAIRMSIILNTLPANIALLDDHGYVIDVNDAWRNFADDKGFIGSNYGIGDNYLDISNNTFCDDQSDGKTVANGIRNVIENKVKEFVFEYPCHSEGTKRWFRMVATPSQGKEYAGAVVMHIDISEIRKLEQERLESKEEEQKNITQAMLSGQEKERNAIGVELHDNVNQILVGTNLVLAMLKNDPSKVSELIPSCIENIRSAINENRKIAHELVTPDLSNETLIEQLLRLCENMLKTGGLHTDIHHEDFSEHLLTSDQKLAIYRVAQEQCTNIIKYARAGTVMFLLYTMGTTFSMRISDDGQGMDEEKAVKGIGLRNISSRVSVLGGTVNIDTAPGKGFALEIEIPIS